jgi:DNA-binding SARP family transcriptional activator
VRLRMLGPVRVWSGDGWMPVAALQQRLLLATLLVDAGQVVSTQRLMYEVWGDRPPRTALKTVHAYVMRLRRLLGDDGARLLVTRDHGYALVIGEGDLDAWEFERLVETGQKELAGGRPDRAAERLSEALVLWQGPALADLPESTTRAARVAQLEQVRLVAIEDHLTALLELDRHAEAEGQLHRLVEEHPLRERLWALLMQAQRAGGHRAEALATYQRARRLLREELGLDPGASLQQLQRDILADDDRPLSTPPSTSPVAMVPAQLPADVYGFTGRHDQLKDLDALLPGTDGGVGTTAVVISAIAGTAGVGKTALAVHWAHEVRDRFPDGQLYVNLRGYADQPPVRPIEALARFLRTLGVAPEQIPSDVDEAGGLYRSMLAGKRLLVLLDNARTADQVRPLLPGRAGCLALVTSRDRLAGLVARNGASVLDLDVLSADEAGLLLTRLLGAERVQAEPAAAILLARLCGRLPLALRIAAANLAGRPGWTIAEYLSELASSDQLSMMEITEDPQTGLRTAFDYSYTVLPDDARKLFRLVGLMPGPDITVDSAAAVAGIPPADAERLLGRLTSGHLIDEQAPGRFVLHDLLRLYAAERTAAEDAEQERAAALGRLHDDYLRRADAAASLLFPEVLRFPYPSTAATEPVFRDHAEALAWLDAERPNLVAVIRHAAGAGHHRDAWRLADVLRGYFNLRFDLVDWAVVAEAGMAGAIADRSPRGQAAVHLSLARLHYLQCQNDQAIDHYLAAGRLSRAVGWRRGEAAALGNRAIVLWEIGRAREAVDHLESALAIDREVGWSDGEATKLANLGVIWTELGRLDLAMDYNLQALRLYRQTGSRAGEARTLDAIGDVHYLSGRFDQAMDTLNQSLAIKREVGDRASEYYCLCAVAEIHADAGRHRQALDLVQRAADRAGETSDRRLEAIAMVIQSNVWSALGEHRRAVAAARRATLAARDAGVDDLETDGLVGLADALRRAGHAGLATGPATGALSIARRVGFRLREGRALTALAAIQLDLDDPVQALQHADLALRIHAETGHRQGEARAHLVAGHAHRRTSNDPGAQSHLQRAHDLCSDIGLPLHDPNLVDQRAILRTGMSGITGHEIPPWSTKWRTAAPD